VNDVSADIIYSLVKSYAIKGALLPIQTIENLAESKDMEDLVSRLRGTIYSENVSKVQKPYEADRLELAFRQHLAFVHYSLMKELPAPELLFAYYTKYIAWNLKTILKGKALGKEYEELSRYIDLYAEELIGRRDLVVRALASKDLIEATDILRESELEFEAESALNIFNEKGEIQIFDIYVDKALYEFILASLKKISKADAKKCRSIIAIDVDSYNILTVFRSKLWGLTQSQTRELIIKPTFDVKEDIIDLMIDSESIVDATVYLEETAYRSIIPITASEKEFITRLEDAFERLRRKKALSPFIWDIFSLSTILGIIKLKEIEVRNLSAIAFGVEQGAEPQNILRKLIL